MDELARQYVISFFSTMLSRFGDRPEGVGWSPKGQRAHYLSLLDIAPGLQGKEVLDFGCGKGDFLTFLRERNVEVRYTGLDINERLIELAREKNPGAEFRVFDIGKEDLAREFDYIFLCGVFNLRIQGLDDIVRTTLETLFAHCRMGMAFNALSSHNPNKETDLFYLSPEEMFTFAVRNLSPFVSLRHDRLSYDFTLFIYRDANRSS